MTFRFPGVLAIFQVFHNLTCLVAAVLGTQIQNIFIISKSSSGQDRRPDTPGGLLRAEQAQRFYLVRDLSHAAAMSPDLATRCLSCTNPVPPGGAEEAARSWSVWQLGAVNRSRGNRRTLSSTVISLGPWLLLHLHADTHSQVHAFRRDRTHTPVTQGLTHALTSTLTDTVPQKARAWLMPPSVMTATKIARLCCLFHPHNCPVKWPSMSFHFKKGETKT